MLASLANISEYIPNLLGHPVPMKKMHTNFKSFFTNHAKNHEIHIDYSLSLKKTPLEIAFFQKKELTSVKKTGLVLIFFLNK